MKKSFKKKDIVERAKKPDSNFALNDTEDGMKVKYRRLLGERKTLKGIVDSIYINDDIEITRHHNCYAIRRTGIGTGGALIIEPQASNVIHIPDATVAQEIDNVLFKRD